VVKQPWIDEGFENGVVGNRLTAATLPPSYPGSASFNVGPPIVATSTGGLSTQMVFGSSSSAYGAKHALQSYGGSQSATASADIAQWSAQTFGGSSPYSIFSNGWHFVIAVRLDRRATNSGAGASLITSIFFTSSVLNPMRLFPYLGYEWNATDLLVVRSLVEPTPIATITSTVGQWYLFDARMLATQTTGQPTKADVAVAVSVTPIGSSPIVSWSKTYSAAADWDTFNGVGRESSLNVRRFQLGGSSATHNAQLSFDRVFVAFDALPVAAGAGEWGVDRIAW
jgi:hypothetical protein